MSVPSRDTNSIARHVSQGESSLFLSCFNVRQFEPFFVGCKTVPVLHVKVVSLHSLRGFPRTRLKHSNDCLPFRSNPFWIMLLRHFGHADPQYRRRSLNWPP